MNTKTIATLAVSILLISFSFAVTTNSTPELIAQRTKDGFLLTEADFEIIWQLSDRSNRL